MFGRNVDEATTVTDDTVGEEQFAPNAPVVRITQLAGDTITLDFEETVTVREYLSRANVQLANGNVVTVNGAPADLDTTVEPGSVVVVAGKINNG